ncbi:hypothetical protein LINGRAHAP2_LOCUS35495 [Linum grandiflorum]
MDINEPSLMDVAHDTINSTQDPSLIVGGSHEIYAGRRNQMKVEGPFDSLRDIAAPSPGAIPEPSSSRAPRAEIFPLIDKNSPPLNRLKKVRLLPASTEEVCVLCTAQRSYRSKPGAIRTKRWVWPQLQLLALQKA